MKNYFLFGLIFIMLFIGMVSCKKTEFKQRSLSTSTIDLTGITPNYFGEIINRSTDSVSNAGDGGILSGLDITHKKKLAKDYAGYYYRLAISDSQWASPTGKQTFLSNYDTMSKAGFAIILNVNTRDAGIVPFPDSASYGIFIRKVLDSLNAGTRTPPAVVVVENEETNPGYYVNGTTTDINKYVLELKAGVNACAPYHIKVTNGGIVDRAVTYLNWDFLKNTRHDTAAARAYALKTMPPHLYNAMYPTLSGIIASQITLLKVFINGYRSTAIDYVNMHWYEPTNVRGWNDTQDGGDPWSQGYNKSDIVPGALDSAVAYFHYTSILPSLPVITNETGQLTTSKCITTNIFNAYAAHQPADFPVVIYYDGDGDGIYDAKALHNTFSDGTYSKRGSGNVWKQNIAGDIYICP